MLPGPRSRLSMFPPKMPWVNPHIYLYLDETDEYGEVTTWTWETVPPAMARRAGPPESRFKGGANRSRSTGLPPDVRTCVSAS